MALVHWSKFNSDLIAQTGNNWAQINVPPNADPVDYQDISTYSTKGIKFPGSWGGASWYVKSILPVMSRVDFTLSFIWRPGHNPTIGIGNDAIFGINDGVSLGGGFLGWDVWGSGLLGWSCYSAAGPAYTTWYWSLASLVAAGWIDATSELKVGFSIDSTQLALGDKVKLTINGTPITLDSVGGTDFPSGTFDGVTEFITFGGYSGGSYGMPGYIDNPVIWNTPLTDFTYMNNENPSGAALAITETSYPTGVRGAPYIHTLNCTGGTSPYSWSKIAGPAWLTAATGTPTTVCDLTGTPTAATTGISTDVRVTDSAGVPATDDLIADLVVTETTVTSPGSLADGTQGVAYGPVTFVAEDGTSPYTWSLVGSLPTGMNFSSAGVLSGTPTVSGSFLGLIFTATDANTIADSVTLDLTINAVAPHITTDSPLPVGEVNTAYSETLVATGSTPITWTHTGGTLPTGLTLETNGLLHGTPTLPGTSTFQITATNSAGHDDKSFDLVISANIVIAPNTLDDGGRLLPYTGTAITASGGMDPYTYVISAGTLPVGITLNSDGTWSGQTYEYDAAGYDITVQVTDDDSNIKTKTYNLYIANHGTWIVGKDIAEVLKASSRTFIQETDPDEEAEIGDIWIVPSTNRKYEKQYDLTWTDISFIAGQTLIVDQNASEEIGRIYNTIQRAIDYAVSQHPTDPNQWEVLVKSGQVYIENLTLYDNIRVRALVSGSPTASSAGYRQELYNTVIQPISGAVFTIGDISTDCSIDGFKISVPSAGTLLDGMLDKTLNAYNCLFDGDPITGINVGVGSSSVTELYLSNCWINSRFVVEDSSSTFALVMDHSGTVGEVRALEIEDTVYQRNVKFTDCNFGSVDNTLYNGSIHASSTFDLVKCSFTPNTEVVIDGFSDVYGDAIVGLYGTVLNGNICGVTTIGPDPLEDYDLATVKYVDDNSGDDEKVKADIADPTSGYLSDKVDNVTLDVNTTTHKIRIKTGAYYVTVGDGVNSFGDFNGTDTAIQDAIDSIDPRGGRIFVKRGVYSPSASITCALGIFLEGENGFNIASSTLGVTINRATNVDTFIMANSSTIVNFYIVDNFTSDTKSAILVDTCSGVLIQNCIVEHTGSGLDFSVPSIKIVDSNTVVIEKCLLKNGGQSGTGASSEKPGILHIETSEYINILTCNITHTRQSGVGTLGISIKDSNECLAFGCKLASDSGFAAWKSATSCSNISLTNCMMTGRDIAPLGAVPLCIIDQVANFIIQGNRIYNDTAYPSLLIWTLSSGVINSNIIKSLGNGLIMANSKEVELSSNHILDCGQEAILGLILGNWDSRQIIRGNYISNGSSDGIKFAKFGGLPANHFESNIEDNIICGMSGHGITLVEDWHSIISNNNICDNVKHGINIASTCKDGVITGNVLQNNDSVRTTTYDGIYVAGQNYTITGNRCNNNDNYEIELAVTADRTIVVSNHCYGSDHVGTILNSGTNTEIAHNIVA